MQAWEHLTDIAYRSDKSAYRSSGELALGLLSDLYALWILTRSYGLDIERDKETNRMLGTLREFRNRYIHRLNRDLPLDIRRHIEVVFDSCVGDQGQFELTHELMDEAFSTIGEVATLVDEAYVAFWHSQQGL